MRRDRAIDAWLAERPGDLASLAKQWFSKLRNCGTDVRELIHDGCPVVCVEDAPFAYVNTFSAHANVGFFHGASLPDPARLLQGTGRYMRHVKLKPGTAINQSELETLVTIAYQDIKERLRAA